MNERIARIPPSLIRTLNARKRPADIDLGLGEPTHPPDLRPFTAALDWTRDHGSPYSPNAGFPELREAIAGYLAADGWAAGPPGIENVCVTVGSEEALYLAIKTVIDPAREEVLVVEPGYLAYAKICILEGIRTRSVALDADRGFQPDAAAVLAAIGPDTRLVVINSPCNPTGRVWPGDELEALAAGLAGRTGPPVHLLTDEVYREIHFGDRPPSAASFHPHTLVAGSLSKSHALTGLRLGWLAGPAEIVSRATTVHQFINTSASTFSQRVAIELFADPESPGAHRGHYGTIRESVIDAARKAGIDLVEPEGAFYLFLRLGGRHAASSLDAAADLLERERVVAVPGRAFGEAGEGWLRVSLAAGTEAVAEGMARIGRWMDRDGGPS